MSKIQIRVIAHLAGVDTSRLRWRNEESQSSDSGLVHT